MEIFLFGQDARTLVTQEDHYGYYRANFPGRRPPDGLWFPLGTV